MKIRCAQLCQQQCIDGGTRLGIDPRARNDRALNWLKRPVQTIFSSDSNSLPDLFWFWAGRRSPGSDPPRERRNMLLWKFHLARWHLARGNTLEQQTIPGLARLYSAMWT